MQPAGGDTLPGADCIPGAHSAATCTWDPSVLGVATLHTTLLKEGAHECLASQAAWRLDAVVHLPFLGERLVFRYLICPKVDGHL